MVSRFRLVSAVAQERRFRQRGLRDAPIAGLRDGTLRLRAADGRQRGRCAHHSSAQPRPHPGDRRRLRQPRQAGLPGVELQLHDRPDHNRPKRTLYDGLRPHDLRHTAVSFWISAGADLTQLKRWAGHESVATLIDTYGHLMPDREGPVLAALEALAASVQSAGNSEVAEILRTG